MFDMTKVVAEARAAWLCAVLVLCVAPVRASGENVVRANDEGAVAAAPVLLSPAWFLEDGSFIRRREEKVAVLSPERLRELQRLIAERNALRGDIAALGRLSSEETEAIRAMDARFAGEYGIRQDRQYSYDAEKMTVFLVSADPRHGGTAEQPALLPHRVFPTDEEAAEFRALMKSKEEALNALRVFEAALVVRREKYRAALASMQSGFSLSLDRAYRLEPETRSVFVQYVAPPEPTPPTPQELAAKKAAEAEAERLAREEARRKAIELREEARRLAEEKKKLAAEETEAERERAEALRRVEKEIAELDAKEAERMKSEAKARAEAEKKAKAEAEKRARAEAEAKAVAEKKAKAEAERKARAEAEARRNAEKKAMAEKKAKEEAEAKARKEAERKARAEAEAKAAAEKKAKEEAEKRARAEAAKKAEAEKAAAEKAYQAALAAEEARLGEERRAAFDAAKKTLADVGRRKNRAEAALKEAERDLVWAKSNKKGVELIPYKEAVTKAEKAIDVADDELSAARKQVKAAEKALSRIKDDAEREIRKKEKAR